MLVAVANKKTHGIHILDETVEGDNKCIAVLQLHSNKILGIKYNRHFRLCISVDDRGQVEYWNTNTFAFPTEKETNNRQIPLAFSFKSTTDLYMLQKQNQQVIGFTLGNTGAYFAIITRSQQIYIFNF